MLPFTDQHKHFFDTFGYLVLPGLVSGEIGWITEEFEAVFRDLGIVHDGTRRSSVVPFIDQRERLSTLLDLPQIEEVLVGALGEGFNYLAGDGNYYTGDTYWHPDGNHFVGTYAKLAFYLDPVGRDTGCLRVIPGSHRLNSDWEARRAGASQSLWGIPQQDVPAVALESQPGDVVLFNHNLLHASFGGNAQRRMFTLNLGSRADSPEEIAELKQYLTDHVSVWSPVTHSDLLKRTAPPGRMRHLHQVIENEGHVAQIHAQKAQAAGTAN